MSEPTRVCRLCGKPCWGVHSCMNCYKKEKGRALSKMLSVRRRRMKNENI